MFKHKEAQKMEYFVDKTEALRKMHVQLSSLQKDSGDSSGPMKYFILHDISTIYFKSFSSFMKNKRILQDQEQICSFLDT